jgi:copper homeostasis protein
MKIELCAASQEAVLIAKELEINRIELCQNLDQGGTTPSAGIIKYAQDFGIETHVLIRPRAGGFQYSDQEKNIMLNDIKFCQQIGISGVVIGSLKQNFEIDTEFIQCVHEVKGDMKLTFHRAFDETIEWKRSMETLISQRVDRILTSGFASNVDIGFQNLKNMVDFADDRIEIMVGGGVNAGNILKIRDEVRPSTIHFSGTVKALLDEESAFSETILKADKNRIERLLDVFLNQ